VWDPATGRELLSFNGNNRVILAAAFSPDGHRILTGSWDFTARLWDAETGREQMKFLGHADLVQSVAFSPDGRRILTGSKDGTARLWETATGRELLTLKGLPSTLFRSVALFSPDGQRILTGSNDATLKIWVADSPEAVEAWRQKEEVEKQTAEQRELPTKLTNELNGAIGQKNWDEAALKLPYWKSCFQKKGVQSWN
jgi:WD40 repeat protein